LGSAGRDPAAGAAASVSTVRTGNDVADERGCIHHWNGVRIGPGDIACAACGTPHDHTAGL
jgi:hypothetical protein